METPDYMKLEIGTKETAKLKPARVKILGVEIQTKKRDGKDLPTPLANVIVKHPDKVEPVKISKIKIERDGKLQVSSLWVTIDEDGKLQKSSALVALMGFLKVYRMEDLTGKEVEAIEESKEVSYLCLKAY